jgi:hypothetical protein
MEYAGVTLLRRNALFVLNNKYGEKGAELISRFSRKTSSALLKSTCEEILAPRQTERGGTTSGSQSPSHFGA